MTRFGCSLRAAERRASSARKVLRYGPDRSAIRPEAVLAWRNRSYFSSTRVPRIFCALIALRNVGNRRSISSKNDDSAGVWVFWL